MDNKLLTVEEVAKILRTTPNTVYRWLRSGRLPGTKIGKEWRIRSETIDKKFSETKENDLKKSQFLNNLIPLNDHVIVIVPDEIEIYNLEVAFFKEGLARGKRLFKGCWWQHPEDVRKELGKRGLPVKELEEKHILNIVDLMDLYKKYGETGPANAWLEEAKKSLNLGNPPLWGSGSPSLTCCGENFSSLIKFEKLLDEYTKIWPIVGICPYLIQIQSKDEFLKFSKLINYHNGLLIYQKDSTTFLRKTYLAYLP